jgi:hypothetical protein
MINPQISSYARLLVANFLMIQVFNTAEKESLNCAKRTLSQNSPKYFVQI